MSKQLTVRPALRSFAICAATLLSLCFAHACSKAPGEHGVAAPIEEAMQIPVGFTSATAKVNGAEIFYLKGGAGPAVILLHGFPEDSFAYRKIMPALAQSFTVVVPDMRGIGRSTASTDVFDAQTEAADIWQLAALLDLKRPYVVGHDMGAMVAYALACAHPEGLRGVMLIESVLPGLEPFDQVAASPLAWHINFQQMPNLPETLITGREEAYFRGEFFDVGLSNKATVDAAMLRHYAASYGSPAQLHSGLGSYRAIPVDAVYDQSHREPVGLPIALIGGEDGIGRAMAPLTDDLRAHGWSRVSLEIIPGGHYLPDENPAAVAAAIERQVAAIPAP
jgi:pimeloyl-ACP methyl ester carboxylesterase